MNVLDTTLQQSFPTVMVPRREPVAEMQAAGERLLMAENGVFLEIRRNWISLVRQIAQFHAGWLSRPG
jgi:PRTRC genetic system protein A